MASEYPENICVTERDLIEESTGFDEEESEEPEVVTAAEVQAAVPPEVENEEPEVEEEEPEVEEEEPEVSEEEEEEEIEQGLDQNKRD